MQPSRAAASLTLLIVALLLAISLRSAAQLQPKHDHMDGIPSTQHITARQLSLAAADGTVTGVASAEAQAEFAAAAAGSRRALLHGNRRARDYSTCPRCTLVTCQTGTNACSGHCKNERLRKLCTSRTAIRVKPACYEDRSVTPDPTTLPVDPLLYRRSVRVTAPAPFFACANVTGAPDGCPAVGTLSTLPGEGSVELLEVTCMQHMYMLPCASATGSDRSPFHPFGYCQCRMQTVSGAEVRAPCQTTDVGWRGSEDGGGVPVSVSTKYGLTRTDIGVRDDADRSKWDFHHTFETPAGPIKVNMRVYDARDGLGYDIVEEGLLSEAEGEEEEEEEEAEEEEEEEHPLYEFLRGFSPS